MPHFISKDMFLQTNQQHNDFYIMDYLVNARFQNLRMLPILYNNEIFFIRCIQREKDFLYKIDKLTKPNNLVKIKEILLFLSNGLEVIQHNLYQTNTKHIKGAQTDYLVKQDKIMNLNPDFIEIGFGSGRHILDLAINNPDKVIVGFEIHAPSIRQVLNAIEIHGLKNLYICNLDARLGIQSFTHTNVTTIFLHFPIPWNKTKHRRVFNRDFLENSFRILKDDGFIDIRSDDENFIKDSINEALSAKFAHFKVLKNKNTEIISKYEARWKKMQKDIYDLHIFKENIAEIQNLYISTSFDFEFSLQDLSQFCNQKWIKDSVFINIGDLYYSDPKADNKIYIAQIAFGSFYMPFNTYLVLEKNGNLHYLKKPLDIQSHRLAHEFLCKILFQQAL